MKQKHTQRLDGTEQYLWRKELSGSIFNMYLYWKARNFVSIV